MMPSRVKIPSQRDFIEFDGAHCSYKWKHTPDNWRCPACNRSKFEILRWTTRFPKSPNKFQSWLAELHNHHDHSIHFFGIEFSIPRFQTTQICGQCNAADGHAKRVLDLPELFSFSPSEISTFITARPHQKHEINYEKAKLLFELVQKREQQEFERLGY